MNLLKKKITRKVLKTNKNSRKKSVWIEKENTNRKFSGIKNKVGYFVVLLYFEMEK